ncbi:MAG: FAD-dependent oxidoreductase, partial [Gemmatimonadetes bacterium]|nr:FAD-dependent oxidoreductase [Gemmatimonadota bacterium]
MLVVGAGIIGRSTAYFLARQGAKVVLLDEGIPAGSPTSRASLGVLTHCNGGDNPYAQLFRDGHA